MILFAKPFPSLSMYRDGERDGDGRYRPDREEDKNREKDFLRRIEKSADLWQVDEFGFEGGNPPHRRPA